MLRARAETRQAVVGLPASRGLSDHRFPLTPEGAGMLVARGLRVKMERGAAAHIHYPDSAYARCGVEIVDRAEAFAADIVIYLPTPSPADARSLKRSALLLTFMQPDPAFEQSYRIILHRNVIALDLARLSDDAGRFPFADILHEIEGRAAMVVGSSLLANSVSGKGILLGGVAGVIPSEVMVIGADMAGCAAAATAIGLGAIVRIFDNNTYRLREAQRQLPAAIGSALHPRVFESAMRSADIIVATDSATDSTVIGTDLVDIMKKGVICFDLTSNPGSAFPSMQVIDLDMADASDVMTERARLCYINAANAVPRTVAMALSNTFSTMLDHILVCDGVTNALKINAGLRSAVLTFLGRCIDLRLARILGIRNTDINLIIQFS